MRLETLEMRMKMLELEMAQLEIRMSLNALEAKEKEQWAEMGNKLDELIKINMEALAK